MRCAFPPYISHAGAIDRGALPRQNSRGQGPHETFSGAGRAEMSFLLLRVAM